MSLLSLVLLLLSVVCAVLPMLLFLGLVWWFDRYDREPIWLVGFTFLWGAIGAVVLALIGNGTINLLLVAGLGAEQAQLLTPVVAAPFVEEPTKALILFLVARSRHFDNTTDGFVYGAAAGLGFGMTENFVYFAGVAQSSVAAWMTTVIIRTLYSAVMHGAATSCVGAAIGFARFRDWPTRLVVVPAGFVVATGIHFLWNLLLVADQALQSGLLTLFDLVLFPLEFAVVFGIFQLCLWDERATIRRELQAEVEVGTLPAQHVPIIASFVKRNRRGWLESHVPLHAYVRAATSLAFRRHQANHTRGNEQAFYKREVDRLRSELVLLLHPGVR